MNGFPYSKEDSIAFPDHVPKVLPNLIQFVLKYAHRPLKLEKGLSICGRICIRHNRKSSAERIRVLRQQIRTINQRIALVRHKKDLLHELISEDSRRLLLINRYLNILQKRVTLKQIQLRSARRLHRVLVSSQGHSLHQHQVAAILDRFEIQQAKLQRLYQNDFVEDEEEGVLEEWEEMMEEEERDTEEKEAGDKEEGSVADKEETSGKDEL